MKIKTGFAVFSAKMAKKAMNILNKKGTHLPGKIASKIDDEIILNMSKPHHSIAITGTNGKTTTANMIADIIGGLGHKYISNRLGSNTYYGISASILDGNTIFGNNKAEYGIFEVDELWSTSVLRQLKPSTLTITNLFQDSFERNANIYYILKKIENSITEDMKLILNANDSISAFIKTNNQKIYFSVENIFNEEQRIESNIEDLIYCPLCEEQIIWDYKRYNHIGEYHCKNCDFSMPKSKYTVKSYNEKSNLITIYDDGEILELPLIQKTIESVYNQICVYATLRENGFSYEDIKNSMSNIRIVSSRYNSEIVDDTEIISMVAKGYNPVANSRVFDTIGKADGKKFVVYLFDNLESKHIDVRTPGWISSIDFKYLLNGLEKLIIKSRHSNEFLVAALLQGIPKEKIVILDDLKELKKYISRDGKKKIFILHDIENINLAQAEKLQDYLVQYLKGDIE